MVCKLNICTPESALRRIRVLSGIKVMRAELVTKQAVVFGDGIGVSVGIISAVNADVTVGVVATSEVKAGVFNGLTVIVGGGKLLSLL